MNFYEIRITTDDELHIQSLVHHYSSLYMYAYEIKATHPHYHIFIHSESNQPALRTYIRNLGYTKKYKLSKKDEPFPLELLSYFMKEQNWCVSDNFPEDKLEEIKAHSLQVKKEIKEKKKNKRTQLQAIEDLYFSNVINGIDTKREKYVDREYVVESVLQYYRDNHILIRKFHIVSLCQTLCFHYVNSYDLTLKQQIHENLV